MKVLRSLILWLGLPGFLFLLWLWKDSTVYSSWLGRKQWLEASTYTIVVRNGVTLEAGKLHLDFASIRNRPARFYLTNRGGPFIRELIPAHDSSPWFRRPQSGKNKDGCEFSAWHLAIPFPVLVAVYFALWLGIYLWRQWVKKKAMAVAYDGPGEIDGVH